jgi:hypothetical protein
MTRLQLKFSGTQALTSLFILGFVVRLIPEILAYPYPISWDMINYAYVMKTGIVWDHWTSFFTSSWLLYAFIVPIHNQFGVDPFLLLKITGPILFGFNTSGVYWFAKSLLNWGTKKSFLAASFFSLQLASLRISSDLLRNTLGLGLLLFTLPLTKRLNSWRGYAAFSLLSLLTVFAHEYTAVTLLVITLVLVFSGLLSREEKRIRFAKKLIVAILPASIVFLADIYLRIFPVSYVHPPTVGPNLVWANDTTSQTYGALFFFVNYLGMNTGSDFYPNYLFLVVSVLALFALLYLPYFYMVWKGFFRNEILDVWTGLLFVGALGCLVTPFFALDLWYRWMFMLVYPFTFYAAKGGEILLSQISQSKIKLGKMRNFKNKVSVMVLATVFLGAVYLATPFLMVHVGFGIYSIYPTSRYFSSAPAVPFQDVNGTIHAMQWLRDNMHSNSCAILQNAFATWARLYLENSQNVIAYVNNVNLAVNLALQYNYQKIYFVCWNKEVSWYGMYVPKNFVALQSFDRMSVFEYAR